MGIDILTQLIVKGWILTGGIPASSLSVGFGYEVIVAGHGSDKVTCIGYQLTVLTSLDTMIDVDGRVLHLAERLDLVSIVERRHETVGDKLVLALVFIHYVTLPVEEVGNLSAVISLPFVLI